MCGEWDLTSLILDLFVEVGQVVKLELDELLLVSQLDLVRGFPLLAACLVGLDPLLQLVDSVLHSQFVFFKLFDFDLKIFLSMLGLELLPHRKGDRTLIQSLVGLARLLDIVTDASQEQASDWLIESDLSDDFIEALAKEFFTDGAEATVPGLSLKQLLVEHLSKTGHIDPRCLLRAHVLNDVLALLNPLTGWQEGVEHIVGDHGLVIEGWQRCLLHRTWVSKKIQVRNVFYDS